MTVVTIAALNQHCYCPRRCALMFTESVFTDNAYTLEGTLLHEHVDLAGYEQRAGWTLLRALPVYSETLGLSGKADLVEVQKIGGTIREARPVEYKRGRKREWDNDTIQLCAQALCLETMLGIEVREGAVFHAQSKARRTVIFTPTLREKTRKTVADVRALLESQHIPEPVVTPRCEGCSLYDTCLPQISRTPHKHSPSLFVPLNY